MPIIRWLAALGFVVAMLASRASAIEIFSQAQHPSGGQYKSAWYAPDGLDSDEYVYDDFTLVSGGTITEIRWRGGYTNSLSGAGRAPVYDFTISIFRSIAGGSQPDMGTSGRLARWYVGSNAGEAPAGIVGGVQMYDYAFVLPAPFQAAAGTKYWVQIEAWQGLTPTFGWPPDWSIARGTGGNNSHFRRIGGTGGSFTTITGDATFSLHTSGAPTFVVDASVQPVGTGAVTGAGPYPAGSTATLTATPAAGFGFARWTENGATVSTARVYTFGVTAGRVLVANFVPAFTIDTACLPPYAGGVTGAGTYNTGSTVTLAASPNPGFVFTGWSDGATEPVHSFIAGSNVIVTAFFSSAPGSVTFDFDNAPVHTALPIDLTVGGLAVHLSATGGGFSVQPAGTLGLTPQGFSGLCLYPSTVFAADLVAQFSSPIRDFSILYCPQELGCDDSATMRATAFRGAAAVATATATAPQPGSYPTGRLAVAAPAGQSFDRVVVHYDARPPTCQDWGPIFLADIMTVTHACAADFNAQGGVTVQDIYDFLSAWNAGLPSADFNGANGVTVQDIYDFLAAWNAGCP